MIRWPHFSATGRCHPDAILHPQRIVSGPLTPDQERRFWILLGAGLGVAREIPAELGVSPKTLRKWMRSQGIPPGPRGIEKARRELIGDNT